jgi:hypothetical protein
MSHCNRFEEEGLEAETFPEGFAEHLQACKECQQAQISYESLCQLLRQCQTPVTMPLEWKEKVWRAIDAQKQTQQKPSLRERWRAAIRPYHWVLGGMAAAAMLGWVFFSTDLLSRTASTTAKASTAFEWSILDVASSQIRSANSAKLGNRIQVKAHLPPASQVALLVYLQNRLVFSCSPATLGQHCQQTENTLNAQVPLEHLGLYRALWVVSSKPLPALQESFDLDAVALLRMGANLQHPFTREVY